MIGLKIGLRIGLTGLLLVCAGAVALHSAAIALTYSNPALAVQLSPTSASALATAANLLSPDAAKAPQAIALAREALRRDATQADAASTLALLTEPANGEARTARLIGYGVALSRRNLAAQIWLIEARTRANDVGGALHHYDIALRTSELAPTILYPILNSALADPQFVPPIAKILREKPVWGVQFATQLSASTVPIDTIAALLTATARPEVFTDPLQQGFTRAAFDRRAYDAAWAIYHSTRPAAARLGVRDPGFAGVSVTPTLFDWELFNDGGITAATGDGLTYAAAGADGVAARQYQALTAGAYSLTVTAAGTAGEGSPERKAAIGITCHSSEQRLVTIPLDPARGDRVTTRAAFIVPAGCGGQRLELFVHSPDATVETAGMVTAVTISARTP
jgi:hypothetical protein